MLGDFVLELASAPGNAATINLAGAVAGRVQFRTAYPTGSSVLYVMSDESGLWEMGAGTSAVGTPDTLARTTVLKNSSGTTSRINFTGTTYVYTGIPAAHAVYRNGSSQISMLSCDLTNIGSINSGPAGGFRNRVLNSMFDQWTVATSFSTPTTATVNADCWKYVYDGSGSAFTISRQTVSDTSLLNVGIKYNWRCAYSSAGTGAATKSLIQRIEGVHTLASRPIVVGVWAKADTSRSMGVKLVQYFGSSGSASVTTTLTSQTVTSSWAHYEFGGTLPSISGKTISGGDDYLSLEFTFPVNTASTFDIADPQLMEGTALPAAMHERRPVATEINLCRRYVTKIPIYSQFLPYGSNIGSIAGQTPVPMFKTPTINWSGTGQVFLSNSTFYTSSNAPTMNGYNTDTGGFSMDWNGFTGLTAGVASYLTSLPSTAWFDATL